MKMQKGSLVQHLKKKKKITKKHQLFGRVTLCQISVMAKNHEFKN